MGSFCIGGGLATTPNAAGSTSMLMGKWSHNACGFEHKGGLCRQEVCSQHHVDAKGSTALWVGLAGHESTSTLGPFLRNEMYRNNQSE